MKVPKDNAEAALIAKVKYCETPEAAVALANELKEHARREQASKTIQRRNRKKRFLREANGQTDRIPKALRVIFTSMVRCLAVSIEPPVVQSFPYRHRRCCTATSRAPFDIRSCRPFTGL